MAYLRPRPLQEGDIITAEDWNVLVSNQITTIEQAVPPVVPPVTPSLIALAGIAAAASASQQPISRRRLLGFLRG